MTQAELAQLINDTIKENNTGAITATRLNSILQQLVLDYQHKEARDVANGYAGLDEDGFIDSNSIPDHSHNVATTSANGFMAATDKITLNSAFKSGSFSSDATLVKFNITKGDGSIITPALPTVSQQYAGTMSPTDKIKIDNILSGYYTPTVADKSANISTITAYECQYSRNGNVVTISGSFQLMVTDTSYPTWYINLPIASNFTNAQQCSGTMNGYVSAAAGGFLRADATNDRIQLGIYGIPINTSTAIYFIAQYRII